MSLNDFHELKLVCVTSNDTSNYFINEFLELFTVIIYGKKEFKFIIFMLNFLKPMIKALLE